MKTFKMKNKPAATAYVGPAEVVGYDGKVVLQDSNGVAWTTSSVFRPIVTTIPNVTARVINGGKVSIGGVVDTLTGTAISTPSTSGNVVVTVKVNNTLVLTLTFAATTGSLTPTWVTPSSFTVAEGDELTYEITSAGTGAAGITIKLNV